MKKEYHNAIFDERIESMSEHQQTLIGMFFGSSCRSVAEAIVIWMRSSDCSQAAADMILDYKNEYDKLMNEYAKRN